MKTYELFSKYKTLVSSQKAKELLDRYCKDAYESRFTPIVRGMSAMLNGFGIIQGDKGHRKSANTSNEYTLILDHTLGSKGYPLRSKSIICGNYKNKHYASEYGDKLFAIIPFDDVAIGVVPHYDIWLVRTTLFGCNDSLENLNEKIVRTIKGIIPDYDIKNFNDLTEKFYSVIVKLKKERDYNNTMFEVFKKAKSVKSLQDVVNEFERAYSEDALKMKLATTKEHHVYNDGREHELWIGGPCVAIEAQLYNNMFEKQIV